jgi:hypothetical protein
MTDRERQNPETGDFHLLVGPDQPQVTLWPGRRVRGPGDLIEHVVEPISQNVDAYIGSINGDRPVPAHRKNPQIVQPMGVVGVMMREPYRVEMVNPCTQQLETKLRWRVDEEPTVAAFDERTVPGPTVSWVGGTTRLAATAYYGNPERRAGSEKAELHPLRQWRMAARI